MTCHFCGHAFPSKKIGFRSLCMQCNSWLHCCRNCQNHREGLPCSDVDPISDKENANFCERFTPKNIENPPQCDVKTVSKKLFGDDGL